MEYVSVIHHQDFLQNFAADENAIRQWQWAIKNLRKFAEKPAPKDGIVRVFHKCFNKHRIELTNDVQVILSRWHSR